MYYSLFNKNIFSISFKTQELVFTQKNKIKKNRRTDTKKISFIEDRRALQDYKKFSLISPQHLDGVVGHFLKTIVIIQKLHVYLR